MRKTPHPNGRTNVRMKANLLRQTAMPAARRAEQEYKMGAIKRIQVEENPREVAPTELRCVMALKAILPIIPTRFFIISVV